MDFNEMFEKTKIELRNFNFNKTKLNMSKLDLEDAKLFEESIDENKIIKLVHDIRKYEIRCLRIKNSLDILSYKEQQIIIYRDFEKLSIKEIARKINTSVQMIQNIKHEAINKLVKVMYDY